MNRTTGRQPRIASPRADIASARPLTRRATVEDYRRLAGHNPPEAWTGIAVELRGELVGMGGFCWWPGMDDAGEFVVRAWACVDVRKRLPPVLLHRTAKRMLARLRASGEPVVYAFSDPRMPNADRWLRRLGFEIDLSVAKLGCFPVWSMRLNDG